MHCHLERHSSWGMNIVLIVKNGTTTETSLRPPPANLPTCSQCWKIGCFNVKGLRDWNLILMRYLKNCNNNYVIEVIVITFEEYFFQKKKYWETLYVSEKFLFIFMEYAFAFNN